MAQRIRLGVFSLVVTTFLVVLTVTGMAQKPAAAVVPATGPAVVAVATLQTFIPQFDGWTRGPLGGDVVEISASSGYSMGTATFTNGDMKIRLTVADSVAEDGCLLALAATVTMLPEGAIETPSPSMTITRSTFQGYQSAATWDSVKLSGEFSVVINGRFVVTAEGTHLDTIDTLRTLVGKVDLKKLSQLTPGK